MHARSLVTIDSGVPVYNAGTEQPHPNRVMRWGVYSFVVHGRSRMTKTLASLQCRDGARGVFTDQAGIA